MRSISVVRGQRRVKVMPYSEVCMHLRVAGRPMEFEVVGDKYPAVQLYRPDGSLLSFPIGLGEAGVFRGEGGALYFYPDDSSPAGACSLETHPLNKEARP